MPNYLIISLSSVQLLILWNKSEILYKWDKDLNENHILISKDSVFVIYPLGSVNVDSWLEI